MSGNKWWLKEVGAKLLSDLVIFSTLSSDNALDFQKLVRVALRKYLMYFLVGINTKELWDIPEEKYFVPLRILYQFIKSLVSPFLDITSTLFDS